MIFNQYMILVYCYINAAVVNVCWSSLTLLRYHGQSYSLYYLDKSEMVFIPYLFVPLLSKEWMTFGKWEKTITAKDT